MTRASRIPVAIALIVVPVAMLLLLGNDGITETPILVIGFLGVLDILVAVTAIGAFSVGALDDRRTPRARIPMHSASPMTS